jgi:hypothetical protein
VRDPKATTNAVEGKKEKKIRALPKAGELLMGDRDYLSIINQ